MVFNLVLQVLYNIYRVLVLHGDCIFVRFLFDVLIFLGGKDVEKLKRLGTAKLFGFRLYFWTVNCSLRFDSKHSFFK